MYDCIKYAWIVLTVFTICGLIAMLPYEKWQKAYFKEYHKIKHTPQHRIDATYKYIEEVENGNIDTENGIDFETYIKKLTKQEKEKPSTKILITKPYQKPLYIRDKHNPKILRPYRG